jgi:hypothetical protein
MSEAWFACKQLCCQRRAVEVQLSQALQRAELPAGGRANTPNKPHPPPIPLLRASPSNTHRISSDALPLPPSIVRIVGCAVHPGRVWNPFSFPTSPWPSVSSHIFLSRARQFIHRFWLRNLWSDARTTVVAVTFAYAGYVISRRTPRDATDSAIGLLRYVSLRDVERGNLYLTVDRV